MMLGLAEKQSTFFWKITAIIGLLLELLDELEKSKRVLSVCGPILDDRLKEKLLKP